MTSEASFAFGIAARPYDDPDVTRMVEAVQAEYVEMYGGPDRAVVDAGEFVPPAGVLLVGTLDGEAVSTCGWRRLSPQVAESGLSPQVAESGLSPQVAESGLSPHVAELKRLYVDPRVRGRGLSRVMLLAAERSAVEAGIEEFVLNTGPEQRAAVALYERTGYAPSPPFGHYACVRGALFFAKRLDRSE